MYAVTHCTGMGRAICKSLRSAGAVVYALDKSQPHLDSLVSKVLQLSPVCLSDWLILLDQDRQQNYIRTQEEEEILRYCMTSVDIDVMWPGNGWCYVLIVFIVSRHPSSVCGSHGLGEHTERCEVTAWYWPSCQQRRYYRDYTLHWCHTGQLWQANICYLYLVLRKAL